MGSDTGDRPAGSHVGRFEIVRLLGRGSMGAVYLARDPLLGRKVAVKTLSGDFSVAPAELALLRRRLLNEARSAGTLRHPGIVTIYDVIEEEGGRIAIAMEFVAGRTLQAELESRPLPPLRQVVDITSQVAATLDHAHDLGVVHRDIKPANLILTDEGGVKIADFGIASLRGDDLASELNALGTPNYLAPERILGAAADERSDTYSLGVVVYEMLTGTVPFSGKTMGELARSVVHDEPADPRSARPDLPQRVADLLARALDKEPARRFFSAGELARELASAVATEAVFSATVRLPTPGELGLAEEAGYEAEAVARTAGPGGGKAAPGTSQPTQAGAGPRLVRAGLLVAAAAALALSLAALGQRGRQVQAEVGAAEAARSVAAAEWLARSGDGEAAVAALERRLGPDASVEELESLAQGLRSTAAARRAAELEAEARANFETARRALEQRDLGATEEALEALREIDPDHEGGAALASAVDALRLALVRRQPPPRPAAPAEPPVSAPEEPEAIVEAPPPVEVAPRPTHGTVRVDFASQRSKGVLTIYAGGEQILRRNFRFIERTGLLRRRKTAGGFEASRRMAAGTHELRVYLALPGRPAQTVRLEVELEGGDTRSLTLRVGVGGELTAEIL